MIPRMRAAFGLLAALAVTLVLVPPIFLSTTTGFARETILHRLWHGLVARALGLRVRRRGHISDKRPLLLAANHVSWTDILALGSLADLSFIAKSELSAWPLVGALSRLQRTVFVERDRKAETGRQADEIALRLNAGDPMVLFAEGTTADGNSLLPFKSALFGAAERARALHARPVFVQPVAIVYTRLHGLPMGRRYRFVAAWIGSAGLGSHLAALLAHAAMDVEVHFGAPLELAAENNRKAVARQAEEQVRAMAAAALRQPA